jgi:pimeloyl-ACP methyl ester carboxylesterase
MSAYAALTTGEVWHDEHGRGDPLVLLHGGAVDSRFFDQDLGQLAERFRVIRTDLWGHGRTADRDGPFSLDSFARDVAELIEQIAGGPALVLGHSIGAAVALILARRRPDLVRRMVQISGGFRPDAELGTEARPIGPIVDQTVAFLGTRYDEVSPDGEAHFPVVVRKDLELSSREPNLSRDEVGAITTRTLVMAADDDIVSLEEMLEFYRALPDAELAIVPGTSHFLLQEKPALCNAIVIDFLANDPVPTVASIRRVMSPEG